MSLGHIAEWPAKVRSKTPNQLASWYYDNDDDDDDDDDEDDEV